MKLKSQIEAILFLSDKPVKAAAMARIVGQDVQVVRQSLLELIHDYEERDGSLEITDDDGYLIQVRDEYASIVDEFAPMEMPISLVRTLSAIAIKQPVAQSEIIKIRGAGAYDHIKELMLRDLIAKKEEGGRSPSLSTTKKFQEYFRLTQDAKQLRGQLSSEVKAAKDAAAALLNPEGNGSEDGGNDAIQPREIQPGEVVEVPSVLEPVHSELSDESDIPAEHKIAAEHATLIQASVEAIAQTVLQEEEEVELEVDHLKSQINLENLFATSPDASLVYRPATTDQSGATVGAKESGEKEQGSEN